MKCHHCARAIDTTERVGFRDDCPGCGRALHACLNCDFYDQSYNNSCRENQAERVVDKDRFNFCEYFTPSKSGRTAGGSLTPKSSAQSRLEELFKKNK